MEKVRVLSGQKTMTWGEFKKWVEDRGVKDEHEINFMDWSHEPNQLDWAETEEPKPFYVL